MANNEYLVQVEHLKEYFPVRAGFGRTIPLKAVDNVSFSIRPGETLGLVGESGCGKTTVGRSIVRLYEPTDGQVLFDGQDITHMNEKQLAPFRRRMQMIFQDPYASLNPRMTVSSIIAEPLRKSGMSDAQQQARVRELIDLVGLKPDHMQRYPHEFSGGQRQRIGIARALAIEPEFIVCDEPISALDVSIQAQVINLLHRLQERLGLTYLFIAHDLNIVKYISDRIAVMYLGSVVELATSDELYANTLHPYSKALLSAVPIPDPRLEAQKKRQIIEGDVPSPINKPRGCAFSSRCPLACEACRQSTPVLKEAAPGHYVACHLVEGK